MLHETLNFKLSTCLFLLLFNSLSWATELNESTIKNLNMNFQGLFGSGTVDFFHYTLPNGEEFTLDKKVALTLRKRGNDYEFKYGRETLPFEGLPSSLNEVKGFNITGWTAVLSQTLATGGSERLALEKEGYYMTLKEFKFSCIRKNDQDGVELALIAGCFSNGDFFIKDANILLDAPIESSILGEIKDIRIKKLSISGKNQSFDISMTYMKTIGISIKVTGLAKIVKDSLVLTVKKVTVAGANVTDAFMNSLDGLDYPWMKVHGTNITLDLN